MSELHINRHPSCCTGHILRSMEFVSALPSRPATWPCRLAENGSLHQKRLAVQVNNRPSMPNQQQAPRPSGKDPKQREDFYANIGEAIRTLKAEIPRLFQEDLTCEYSLRRFYPATSKASCYHLTLIPELCIWNSEPPFELQHGHFARQQVYIAKDSQMFGLRLRDKSEI